MPLHLGALFAITLVAGAHFDSEARQLSAQGAAAADLRAPSAQVARVKAERTAHERAEKKLAAALKELGYKKTTDEILKKAEVLNEEFGSDGSVQLTLRATLPPKP